MRIAPEKQAAHSLLKPLDTERTHMIVHRCTWYYSVSGESFAQKISFKTPVTASQVREILRKTMGLVSVEIWSH